MTISFKVFDSRLLCDSLSKKVALASDEVHIWQASLDRQATHTGEILNLLSRDEKKRAKSFRFERDGRRFIVRRGLLRMLLGCYLHAEPERIEFSDGMFGKPSITEPSMSRVLCFSMSHSFGIAVYAIAWERKLGVDIEYVRPVPEAEEIAKRLFLFEGNRPLDALPQDQKMRGFFSAWTRKEAYVKATGYGLCRTFGESSIILTHRTPFKPLGANRYGDVLDRWSFLSLTTIPGFVVSLCIEEDERQPASGERFSDIFPEPPTP